MQESNNSEALENCLSEINLAAYFQLMLSRQGCLRGMLNGGLNHVANHFTRQSK